MANRGGKSGKQESAFIFQGSIITVDSDCSHEIKTLASFKKSYDKARQHIKKQRHHFADKGLSSQGYSFSSGHVWMWEVDYKESWAPKNWCFPTVVLEKTCGAAEDAWESHGQQGDHTNQSERKSTLNIHSKDFCWGSNTLDTWCKKLTH